MYVSQIIGLYTLNIYRAICQLYLSKTGSKDTPSRMSTAHYRYGMNPPGGKQTPSVPVWAAGFLDCDRSRITWTIHLAQISRGPGICSIRKKSRKLTSLQRLLAPWQLLPSGAFNTALLFGKGFRWATVRYFWAGQWAKKQKQLSFPKNVWIKYTVE